MSTVTAPGPTGPSLRGLVRAQLVMLRTRGVQVLLALSVIVPVALIVLVLAGGQQTFDLTGADLARPLTDNIGRPLFAVLIGVFVAGSAYRHGTIVPLLLAEPRRLRVAGSALLVSGALGAVVAVVCALLGAAIALPWLGAQGVPLADVLADPALWWTVLGRISAMTATAVLGAGLAVLCRGVLGPVLGYLGAAIADGVVIDSLWPDWARWSFFEALLTVRDPTAAEPSAPLWTSAIIVVAVLAAVVTAALVSTTRRDAV